MKYRKFTRIKDYNYKLPCSLLQGIPSGKFVLRLDTPQQDCGVFRSQNKSNGYYFVIICTDFKQPFFNNPKIKEIVVAELALLKERFSGLDIDYFVIMPHHIHIIFILKDSDNTLPQIVQAFKSITTIRVKKVVGDLGLQNKVVGELALHKKGKASFATTTTTTTIGKYLWQKNYYEHIIRDEKALYNIRKYIQENPLKEKIDWDNIHPGGKNRPIDAAISCFSNVIS